MTELRDFSRTRKKIAFKIDEDVFPVADTLASENLLIFISRLDDAKLGNPVETQHKAMMDMLSLVMPEDDHARLTDRTRSVDRPVDMDQLADVVMWLLEVYGLRPTMPSASSADGSSSPESGTASTESTPDAESTSSPSPQTGS
jgi:hypothetical protein